MLDRSLGGVKSHSTMSFGRKWVSDTNLSKLLHETIEKKHANKQSKLPDFCKDAILSATIKKISSALVVNHSDLPFCENDVDHVKCDKKDNSAVDNPEAPLCNEGLLDKVEWEDDLDTPMTMAPVAQEEETDMIDDGISAGTVYKDRTSPSFLCRRSPCSSPKRKRQPSSEGVDIGLTCANSGKVTSHASPRKKRREYLSKSQNSSPEIETLEGVHITSTWVDDGMAISSMHLTNNHIRGQRSQSLPHLNTFLSTESMLIASKKNFSLSPVSVVNSISELSIHDCWEPTDDGSWCYPKNESAETDPLELNDFFQELKSVSVHPD